MQTTRLLRLTTLLNSVDIEESIALKGKMSVEMLGINQS